MSLVPFVFVRGYRKIRRNTSDGLPARFISLLYVLCLNVLPFGLSKEQS
jgi:hypothetical protein